MAYLSAISFSDLQSSWFAFGAFWRNNVAEYTVIAQQDKREHSDFLPYEEGQLECFVDERDRMIS